MLDTNSKVCEAVVLSDVVGRLKMLEAEAKKASEKQQSKEELQS